MDAVQKIKETIGKEHIKGLLENHSRNLYDTGEGFRGCCPLHGGDNPTAFFWNYQNGLWYCFTGCNMGGDIFDYIRLLEEIPEDQFPVIVERVAFLLGIDIEGLEVRERTREAMMSVQEWVDYIRSRTIRDTNRAYDLHQLGDLFALNSYRNFTKETIDFFKACYSRTHNRIVAPLHNESGVCVGASLRRLDSREKIKWLHLPKAINTRHILYNVHNCESSTAYVVEGAFDVWNLHQIGVKNSVAVLGSHLTPEQEKILLRHFTDVVLVFDNDKAGLAATQKAINQLKHKINLSILDLGEYKDPGEIEDIQSFSQLSKIHYSKFVNPMV